MYSMYFPDLYWELYLFITIKLIVIYFWIWIFVYIFFFITAHIWDVEASYSLGLISLWYGHDYYSLFFGLFHHIDVEVFILTFISPYSS